MRRFRGGLFVFLFLEGVEVYMGLFCWSFDSFFFDIPLFYPLFKNFHLFVLLLARRG